MTEVDTHVGSGDSNNPASVQEVDTATFTMSGSGSSQSSGSLDLTAVDPTLGTQIVLHETDHSSGQFTFTGSDQLQGGVAAGNDLPTTEVSHFHLAGTVSGGSVISIGMSGNLSGGTTADLTQAMTSTYAGSTLFDSTYTSGSAGNGTEVDTFSGTFQATIDGNGSQNISTTRVSNSGNGNAVSISESDHQTNQLHGTINSSITGQATIVAVGGQITSDVESDTVTETGTLTFTTDDTSHMNDVTTSVDPVINMATTTTKLDNGSTNHTVTTLVPTSTAVHTEALGGTATDVVSGGANATTQSTYQGHLQETVAWVGTDAQGVTHHNQQVIGADVAINGTTTSQATFAADGSSSSQSTTQQTSQGTKTTTNTGTISSLDTATGLVNTTALNEIFTISGMTTATIGNVQSTDTSHTTTTTSTTTDSGTLNQGWQIHDSTTKTDSNGNTVATQATDDTNQNTLTLENGNLTSQGAATPSPPGNQNNPAPGANAGGGGTPAGQGSSAWWGGGFNPGNWSRGFWTGDFNAADNVFDEAYNTGWAVLQSGETVASAVTVGVAGIEVVGGAVLVTGGGYVTVVTGGLAAPITVPASWLGASLVAHGVDTGATEFYNIANLGDPTKTLTSRGMDTIGVPPGFVETHLTTCAIRRTVNPFGATAGVPIPRDTGGLEAGVSTFTNKTHNYGAPTSIRSSSLGSVNSGVGIGSKQELIQGLRGTTAQAERIADAIENGSLKVSLLGDDLYNQMIRGQVGERASAIGNQIYLRKGASSVLSDAVHEGTHALDNISGFGFAQGQPALRYSIENRAYWYERQFQLWTNQPVEHSTVGDLLKHVKGNYSNDIIRP